LEMIIFINYIAILVIIIFLFFGISGWRRTHRVGRFMDRHLAVWFLWSGIFSFYVFQRSLLNLKLSLIMIIDERISLVTEIKKTLCIACTWRMVLIPISCLSFPGTTRADLLPPDKWVDGGPFHWNGCRPSLSANVSAAFLLVQRKGECLESLARLDQLGSSFYWVAQKTNHDVPFELENRHRNYGFARYLSSI
jgi:hypothetical protein